MSDWLSQEDPSFDASTFQNYNNCLLLCDFDTDAVFKLEF
jgi:hypothetical protein